MQSLMKLANKKGNEVGPEVVDEIERERVNVVSNTQLKVCMPHSCPASLIRSSQGLTDSVSNQRPREVPCGET